MYENMSEGNKKSAVTASDVEILLRTQHQYPILYDRVMELLHIVHEPQTRKADDVEYNVIDNLRQMGKEALSSWAQKHSDSETKRLLDESPELKRSEKKSSIGRRPTEKSRLKSKF
jgi:hypothetical protein